jgi:hypothetical protein
MWLVPIGAAKLEVSDRGSGDPVVLVQTTLTADEFGPLADQPPLRNGFRTVLY